MLLTTTSATITAPATTFRVVVPGAQEWRLRSVYATATTAVGGAPDRGFTLTITDGTNTVAKVGADDTGVEPAAVSVTWADTSTADSTIGNVGVSVAPLPALSLQAGYNIVGAIVNPFSGDTWVTAIVWYDFVYTDGR